MDTEHRHKVVYIENETEMIDLVRFILTRENFEVTGALGGVEGLETVRRVKPDIVLLDLMMPDMDGWAVFLQMKADETLNTIPVVVISARAELIEKKLGQLLGVKAYITKPFGPKELMETLNHVLQREE